MTHQLAIYLLVFGGLLLLAVLLDDLAQNPLASRLWCRASARLSSLHCEIKY